MDEKLYSEILNILLNLNTDNVNELLEYHPFDIASTLMDEKNRELTLNVSHLLEAKQFSTIFVHFEDDIIVDLIDDLGIRYVSEMLSVLEVDDASQILLLAKHPKKYLCFLPNEKKEQINQILSYDDDFVGSIMNTNFIELDINMNAKQATKKVMNIAKNVDFINILFVTSNNKYVGIIHLKDLITTSAYEKISDLVDTSIAAVYVEDDKEDASKMLKNYDIEGMAVVDDNDVILGIVTYDDILDVTVDAAVEDYAAFAGMITDNITHENESVFSGFKKRIAWLIILLFTNLFTSTILGNYQASFDDKIVAVLSIFLPLILGMAGNTGTQSLAVTIRLIEANDLDRFKQKLHHLWQEIKVGFCNGIIIGIAMFLIVYLILWINRGQIDGTVFETAITTAIAVFCIMIVATSAGVIIPLIMILFKIDPAVASGPFITTINDILALITYFTLASFFLVNIF